jgi:serine protease Do
MNAWQSLKIAALGTAIALMLALPLTAGITLTPEEVEAVASQITVVIGQGLQKGDIEARQEWNPGSGAIVARNGKRYYVLTALHVVRTRDVVYGVRTSDGEVHLVDDLNVKSHIHPFGNEGGRIGDRIEGLDLAVIEFDSDHEYPVSAMGSSSQLQPDDVLYVSGWPNPDEDDENARRTRRTSQGNLTAIFRQPSVDGGYSLLYDNDTERGMSGGPVLNANGELVGIHGRGQAKQQEYCIDPNLSEENSCGMQTLHFINQAKIEGLQLPYEPPPVNPEVIEMGLAQQEEADTIDNIYDDFTFDLESLLRDGPSGGCGSLLLGDDC